MNTDYPDQHLLGLFARQGVNMEQLFVGVPWSYKYSEKHAFSIMPIFVYQTFEAQGVGSFAPIQRRIRPSFPNNGKSTSTGYGAKIGYHGSVVGKIQLWRVSYQTEMKMGEFDDYAGLFAEQGGFNIPTTWTASALPSGPRTKLRALMMDHAEDLLQRHQIRSAIPLLPNLQTARLGDDEWRWLRVGGHGRRQDRLSSTTP